MIVGTVSPRPTVTASGRRSLLDRALRLVHPVPLERVTPPPRQLADGLWVLDRALRIPPGFAMPCRMTVLRLPDGGLLLHSPVRRDPAAAAAIRGLGRVAAILAPNPFHHLFAAEWHAAHAEASLYAAPGLLDRVPALRDAAVLYETPEAWRPDIDVVLFGPTRGLSEVVLLHLPSATLVLTDLAFNMATIDGTLTRIAWRLAGIPSGFGPSRTARLTLLRDRVAAAAFVEALAGRAFERVVVAHGEVLERDARATVRRAYAPWLAPG